MKKNLLFVLLFFMLAIQSNAQYKIDTLSHRYVGPGVIYSELQVPVMPWTIDLLEVDLKNPYISVESVKADDLLRGFEQVSSMCKRKSSAGHVVVGGVNGDFYDTGTGIPINTQVVNGQMVRTPINLSTMGFDAKNKPMLNIVKFQGAVAAKNASNAISGVNQTRSTDQLIIFNNFFGSTTSTNAYGSEALIRPVGKWSVNDTVLCVVDDMVSNAGNMIIKSGYAVLSGHGTSKAFLDNNLKKGDTVKVYMGLTPGINGIKQLIGGYPKIVANGKNYAEQGFKEEGGPDHAPDRHPRTAIGFSADSSKLYLITVDGRSLTSIGINLKDLADLMIKLGVYWGMNFDGGGSTTMVVRDKVMNVTSDGAERSVANGFIVVSSAPTSTVLSGITIFPGTQRIFRDKTIQFSVSGVDEYYNPVNMVSANIKYSADPAVGTINNSGLFKAANKAAKGYVYVTYGDKKDSALVVVKDAAKISLNPKNVVIDNLIPKTFKVSVVDEDNVPQGIFPNEFTWTLSDPKIGSIDTNGVFSGSKEGFTKIYASYRGLVDSSQITVQIGTDRVLLDSLESLGGWKFSSSSQFDTLNTFAKINTSSSTMGSNSIEIHYELKYALLKQYKMLLETDIPIYGVPDSVYIDVKPDSSLLKLSFVVSDDNDEYYITTAADATGPLSVFDTVGSSLKNLFAMKSNQTFDYPIRFKRLEILVSGKKTVGRKYAETISLDNLRIVYPGKTTDVRKPEVMPVSYILEQNYPNPFNPSTTITYGVPEESFVTLKVYDLLGREISTLVEKNVKPGNYKVTWNAGNMPSGIYFYRMQAGKASVTKKMMLVR